ncbi:DEAD/DEAH box helicase [Yunchengibacter salinarum]|uniref:DEAD/DEAH box helicase n=1 Tax=Yunchengibacter salinarum TaxID=3133399 RepID=UPI0035B5904A
MTISTFDQLGLAEPLERALADRAFTTPTPIQAAAIPALLEGRDVLGIAQTGTGKTAAFALPVIHRLINGDQARPHHPKALILAPTRELASQIAEEVRTLATHVRLRTTVIFGGVNQRGQVKALSRGVDVLIATPGRLLDLMGQDKVRLGEVDTLVLDEADRMLDMGFMRDLKKIIPHLPAKRQSLLFSATMPDSIAALSRDLLNNPKRVEMAAETTPIERITQQVHHVTPDDKRGLLGELLENPALERVIVFTRTKHRADRLATQIHKAGIKADAIHGNKSQNARQRALKNFRDGQLRVLVATDIAARGIDVDDVTHVINFELPNEAESYVHRIGRTARAGRSGTAISFCDKSERGYLAAIQRLTGLKLTVIGDAPPEPQRKPGGKKAGGKPGGRRNGPPRGNKTGGNRPPMQNTGERPMRRRPAA